MKIQHFILIGSLASLAVTAISCKKKSDEVVNISKPEFQAGQTISSDTLSGSVKGTLQKGKTYYFKSRVTVNAGDTLVMQSGVKLLALDPAAQLYIKGVFASLGSEQNPNWITGYEADKNPLTYKHTISGEDPNVDPAFKPNGKLWGGIQCDASCGLLDLKWTHLDFAGGSNGTTPLPGYKAGDDLFVILFQNPNGYLIIEDCWFYGSTTDAARVKGGYIHIMRNTAEKMSYNDGDVFNVKGDVIGDMAYNVIIGSAKGGTKASNKGNTVRQTNVNMYNNTYLNGGFRSVDPDRGANINYEEGARGMAYNNIMVNCRTGLRILENPVADTANMRYGNNLSYGDSASVVNQFYPPGHIRVPKSTDIPNPFSFLPSNYKPGDIYDGSSVIGKNNPQFVNYTLPQPSGNLRDITFIGAYNFRLKSNSPAIGAGYTDFTPLNSCAAITNEYLKPTVTAPNKDLGAYPTDGTGNKH